MYGTIQEDYGYRPFDSSINNYEESEAVRELLERSVSNPQVERMGMRQRTASPWARRGVTTGLTIPHPDRLLTSTYGGSHTQLTNCPSNIQRSQIHLPPKLPHWIWTFIATILGIGSRHKRRILTGTFIHILTLLTALLFGTSGLFFNIYDTISSFSKTSVIEAVTKSILGLYWICLGIYANSLAARLFSNPKMVDCIRLHSKTFMKVSAVFLISLLCFSVVATNLYTNRYLLDTATDQGNSTVEEANCASIGVKPVLCQVYFGSKVVYGLICLVWNLLVVGIFLSVCRTHTVAIRRFMKELLYDTKIYEEFCKLQAQERRQHHLHTMDSPLFDDAEAIWDDDITMVDSDDLTNEFTHGAQLLKTVRFMRQNEYDAYTESVRDHLSHNSVSISLNQDRYDNLQQPRQPDPYTDRQRSVSYVDAQDRSVSYLDAPELAYLRHSSGDTSSLFDRSGSHKVQGDKVTTNTQSKDQDNPDLAEEVEPGFETVSGPPRSRATSKCTTLAQADRPPIMRNEDLMFTYFILLRRLASTSRILQRWIFSWISFTMLWCVMYIIYWINHDASITGIVQFLLPLVILALLSSGFAEVNFEGQRIMKCILPTEERLWVIMYFNSLPLDLKIFSFTMTYNSIVTVVAGIVLTFATRIILDQVT